MLFTAAFLVAVNAALASPQAVAPATPTPAAAPASPQPAEITERPLVHLFHNLAADLKQIGALDTLATLGTAGVVAGISSWSDAKADRWTLEHPSGSWTKLGRIGGDGWTMGSAAIATWLLGKELDKPLMAHVGSDLIRVQALNGLLTRALKLGVSRERPSGGGHSFPSGHVSSMSASASVLQRHFGWKAGVPAYIATSLVGYTRVRDRAHWVSDVVFGAAVGLTSARAVNRSHKPGAWMVTPVKVPGGAALLFTRR